LAQINSASDEDGSYVVRYVFLSMCVCLMLIVTQEMLDWFGYKKFLCQWPTWGRRSDGL